jgi:hypothetical protein
MASQGPGPWSGVLLSDEEALQIIAVLADVLDGHDVRDAVSAAWSLLGNRLGAQAGVADPSPEYVASLYRRLADLPRPWANWQPSDAAAELTGSLPLGDRRP